MTISTTWDPGTISLTLLLAFTGCATCVPELIEYKVAVLTYRVLHGSEPRVLGWDHCSQGLGQKFTREDKRGGPGAEPRWESGGAAPKSRRQMLISSYDGGTCSHAPLCYSTVSFLLPICPDDGHYAPVLLHYFLNINVTFWIVIFHKVV